MIAIMHVGGCGHLDSAVVCRDEVVILRVVIVMDFLDFFLTTLLCSPHFAMIRLPTGHDYTVHDRRPQSLFARRKKNQSLRHFFQDRDGVHDLQFLGEGTHDFKKVLATDFEVVPLSSSLLLRRQTSNPPPSNLGNALKPQILESLLKPQILLSIHSNVQRHRTRFSL